MFVCCSFAREVCGVCYDGARHWLYVSFDDGTLNIFQVAGKEMPHQM